MSDTVSKYGAPGSRKPAPKKPAPKPAPKKPAPASKSTSAPFYGPVVYKPSDLSGTLIHDATPAGTFNGKNEPADSSLIGPLKLPKGLDAASTFVWDYDTKAPYAGGPAGKQAPAQSQTKMTVAGGLSWLRSLAVNDKDHYNLVVHQLVAAGYLSPTAARYGSYTVDVGNGFLKSVADTWAINHDGGVGGNTVRWVDHINDMIQGRVDSGQIGADGQSLGSSGGSQGPVRQDKFSDPETVKATINNAAKSVLGRELTDKEVAAFAGAFHGQEAAWNDKVWSAQQAQAAGGSSTVTDSPSVSAAAKNYEDSTPAQAQERTSQMLGSYMGVLRNMTGLGSGGISDAVR